MIILGPSLADFRFFTNIGKSTAWSLHYIPWMFIPQDVHAKMDRIFSLCSQGCLGFAQHALILAHHILTSPFQIRVPRKDQKVAPEAHPDFPLSFWPRRRWGITHSKGPKVLIPGSWPGWDGSVAASCKQQHCWFMHAKNAGTMAKQKHYTTPSLRRTCFFWQCICDHGELFQTWCPKVVISWIFSASLWTQGTAMWLKCDDTPPGILGKNACSKLIALNQRFVTLVLPRKSSWTCTVWVKAGHQSCALSSHPFVKGGGVNNIDPSPCVGWNIQVSFKSKRNRYVCHSGSKSSGLNIIIIYCQNWTQGTVGGKRTFTFCRGVLQSVPSTSASHYFTGRARAGRVTEVSKRA